MFYTRAIPLIALCIAAGCLPALATETKDEVVEILRRTELPSGSTDDLSDHALSKVALLSKTVEAKRDLYARALELFIERIGAGKDVDQARIEYEKAEISLAAEWKETRKVFAVLNKQSKLAHEWKKHRSLHPPEHHPVEHSAERSAENSPNDPLEHAPKPEALLNTGATFW
jgi:hypothetical protein